MRVNVVTESIGSTVIIIIIIIIIIITSVQLNKNKNTKKLQPLLGFKKCVASFHNHV